MHFGRFFTSLIFLALPVLAHAEQVVIATDAAALTQELSKTDGIVRIVLVVGALDQDGNFLQYDGADMKEVKALNAVLADEAKRGGVKAYAVNMRDNNMLKALSSLPRFPQIERYYPYMFFFKNGGVQARLVGFGPEKKDIALQLRILEAHTKVPSHWTLKPADISLEYIYLASNCSSEQFQKETADLKSAAQKLGFKFHIVEWSDAHPLFSKGGDKFTAGEVFYFTVPGGVFQQNECREVTALYTWQGMTMISDFTIKADHDENYMEKYLTEKNYSQAIQDLETGNY